MELDEVKICVRAILSSTAHSYNVNTLLNDFRNMTGFNLPLFGYSHAVEFLKSLNDTVMLIGDSYNPEIALIESKKSAHITSLVDRQKSALSGKNNRYYPKQKRLIIPDKNSFGEKENEYWRSFRWESPEFGNFESKTSQALLNSNSQNRSDGSDQKPAFTSTNSCFNSNILNKSYTLVRNNASSDTFCNERNDFLSDPKRQEDKSVKFEKPESCYFGDNESCFDVGNLRKSSASHLSKSSFYINEGIKNKFRKLIRNYPNGLWCCELPELFQKEYNSTIDYRQYGYTSLIQMLSELPDVFRCVRPGNEDWILFDASATPSPEEAKMMDLQESADIRCKAWANVKKLLSNCFENDSLQGVEMYKFLDLYKKTFDTCLDFRALGFKDLKSLLKSWEGNLFSILELNGKTFLAPALKVTVNSSLRWEEAVPPITAENDIFVEIFPKEVVGPDESLMEIDLTRHIAVGHVVKVSVAEVWSPSLFYLQLHKFKNRLSVFMDDLQKFYNVHLNKYKMPEATIRPKQVCVGLYTADPDIPDEWHRAQIVKVINEKMVLVNFVDYGTVTRVKKTQLRFLHRNFHSFPVQGFSAQLSGIVPANGETKWPISTSKKFLELVRVPVLNAELVDIDFQKPSMSVILSDPSQESLSRSHDTINRKLVLEGLASEKEPVSVGEGKPEAVSEDSKPAETKELDGNTGSITGSFNKNLAEVTDQFSDIVDLGQSTVFQFKMKCLKPENSQLKVKDEDLKYEFEEVPDLDVNEKIKEVSKPGEEKRNAEQNSFEEKSLKSVSPPKAPSPKPQPVAAAVETEFPALPQPYFFTPEFNFASFSVKPKRLPPGLEHVNPSPGDDQMQFLLPQDDLKKRINCLAIEFLTKNASIKQVGMTDPGLALKIATEMASACLNPEYSRNLASGLDPPPDGPATLPEVPKTEEEPADVAEATEATDSPRSDSPPPDKGRISSEKGEKANEYVKEKRIGGKVLHVVTVDNEFYFCVEEIIRQFTLISNREVADRILHVKKIFISYRILTKATDEKVVNALKSTALPIVKKKTKKLKVYLISSTMVLPFLRALGCHTKCLESEFLNLQSAE